MSNEEVAEVDQLDEAGGPIEAVGSGLAEMICSQRRRTAMSVEKMLTPWTQSMPRDGPVGSQLVRQAEGVIGQGSSCRHDSILTTSVPMSPVSSENPDQYDFERSRCDRSLTKCNACLATDCGMLFNSCTVEIQK